MSYISFQNSFNNFRFLHRKLYTHLSQIHTLASYRLLQPRAEQTTENPILLSDGKSRFVILQIFTQRCGV